MLGIVFSEFLEMVENEFSPEMADEMLTAAHESLPSGGAYTRVGNYDHSEMLVLVTKLSEKTNVPVNELVHAYGKHLFGRFREKYPAFFEDITGCFDFLSGIETRIHKQVRQLYPDAELPTFDCSKTAENAMVMKYSSSRPFAVLAHGLIDGCTDYFKEKVDVVFEDTSGGAMTNATFTLTKR